MKRLVLQADGHYLIEQAETGDAVFSPTSMPGLDIPLARLWAEPQTT